MNKSKEIERLILEGVEAKDIRDSVDCCISLVYAVAKRKGLTVKRALASMPKLDQYHEEIQRDIYKGQSVKAIAKKYKVDHKTALYYVSRYIDYPEGLKQANANKAVELNRNTEADVKAKIVQANPFIEYVGGYTRKQDPVTVRCLVCGQTYETVFSTITHKGGSNCPHCKEAERTERKARRQAERQAKKEQRERVRLIKRLIKLLEAEAKAQGRVHRCPVCGKETTRRKYCSEECRRKAQNKRSEVKRRAKIKDAMVDSDITLEGLFKRDKGVCHICGGKCDYEDYVVTDKTIICGDWYPSIDHVVPLSKGGKHAWSNVKLAHRICNSRKGNR